MSKTTKRVNELKSFFSLAVEENSKLAEEFESRHGETKDSDDKARYQKHQTKAKYMANLASASDEAHNKLSGLIGNECYQELASASYALDKVRWVSETLADNSWSGLDKVSGTKLQMAANLEYLIGRIGNEVPQSDWDKYIKEVGKSPTQQQQTRKMLERMGALKFIKDGQAIVAVQVMDCPLMQKLKSLYNEYHGVEN